MAEDEGVVGHDVDDVGHRITSYNVCYTKLLRVRRVDKVGDQDVDIIKLKYASATEIVRLVTTLTKEDGKNSVSSVLTPKVVADELV